MDQMNKRPAMLRLVMPWSWQKAQKLFFLDETSVSKLKFYCLFHRGSVIVPRLEQSNVIQIELKEDPSDDLGDANIKTVKENKVVLSLSFKELENMYTSEESKYFENMINNFYKNWKSVNLGSSNVSRFISFSRNPGPLFEGYFLFKSKIFR